VVTGLGTINPLGHDVVTTWEGLVAGRSGIDYITLFDPSPYQTRFAGEVKGFDAQALLGRKEARRLDRFAQFAMVAARQAIADAGLTEETIPPERIGVVFGSGVGGIGTIMDQHQVLLKRGPRRISPFFIPMMLADTAPAQIAITYGFRGPNMVVTTACASGTNAVGEAMELIRRGAADVVVAGGAEAAIVPIALAGFNVMGALSTHNEDPAGACRPFDAERDGFVMGEGSAVLVLERLEHAQARGATIYAEVLGYGASADAYHLAAPEETGDGAALAMRAALRSAGIPPTAVDYVNAHGTGTVLNDKSETRAIKTVFGDHAYRLAISATKSMTGHLLGAAGALEALICVKTLQEGIIPPTINYRTPDPECDLDYVPNEARPAPVEIALSNSFGFGGHNASLILARWE